MVACASNPCRLHGGSDIMASSPEEAYAIRNQAEDNTSGLSADNDPSFINMIDAASYDDILSETDKGKSQVDIAEFVKNGIDDDGMMIVPDNDNALMEYIDNRQSISTYELTDDEQKNLVSVIENKKYMDAALSDVDYDKMPAATETINDLASNPSTSEETLSRITNVAVARRNNDNFPKQVYISDIANHKNLNAKDAMRLYKAYPEECVKAQNFNKDIINDVLKDPTSPDRVKAIAITNPRATVSAMSKAIKDGGDAFRAQAMLNPNGKYLNVARKERNVKLKELERDAKEVSSFNTLLKSRTGR
jgi:hypothetical protein